MTAKKKATKKKATKKAASEPARQLMPVLMECCGCGWYGKLDDCRPAKPAGHLCPKCGEIATRARPMRDAEDETVTVEIAVGYYKRGDDLARHAQMTDSAGMRAQPSSEHLRAALLSWSLSLQADALIVAQIAAELPADEYGCGLEPGAAQTNYAPITVTRGLARRLAAMGLVEEQEDDDDL